MHIRIKSASIAAALIAGLIASPAVAFPPGGGGGFRGGGGGGGGGHKEAGGNTAAGANAAGARVNAGVTGGGGAPHLGVTGTAARLGGATGASGAIGAGAGGTAAGFHSGKNMTAGNATTFNPAIKNHTPTFTHPATVTVPANKFAVGGAHSSNVVAGARLTDPAFRNHVGALPFKTGGSQFSNHINNQNNNAFAHNPAIAHNVNPHVYHQAFIGNQSIHLANVGYHPSYLYHPFYHGPWSGNAFGWGWGLGSGFGYGFGGGGWGLGFGSGWGYGGYPYGYAPYGYWGRPLGWGFGGWGLGTIAYNSGYYPYYNPYYYAPPNQTIVYNYSNPIPVAANVAADPNVAVIDNSDGPPPPAENPEFDAARAAFRDEDFTAALANVDAAIARTPTDSVLHEFRALVLFALRDFKQAAGVVHSLLAVGPGWDWTTMSALYADPGAYTRQLRALEEFTLANPKKAEGHFLLAYHYTICSHSEAAAAQLQQVVTLMPTDRLAGELLKMVEGPAKQGPAAPPEAGAAVTPMPPADDAPQPDPIDKDLLRGNWLASRADGSKFILKLTEDGKFTWKFSPPKQKAEEFDGTYSIEGAVLILQRAEGGALAGTATFDGTDKFNFRMVGAPPEDKGLDFGK